jgi:hypothetical protein
VRRVQAEEVGFMNDSSLQLDHYYTFGDVYETFDVCEQLNMMLSRLRRQDLLDDDELGQSRRNLAAIRSRIEAHLNSANLMPKGPRLP